MGCVHGRSGWLASLHERVIDRHNENVAGVFENGRVYVARDVGVGATGTSKRIFIN